MLWIPAKLEIQLMKAVERCQVLATEILFKKFIKKMMLFNLLMFIGQTRICMPKIETEINVDVIRM